MALIPFKDTEPNRDKSNVSPPKAGRFKRKAKYGGMEVSEAKPLKTLEDENSKLKRMKAITNERRPFGYRGRQVGLRREGHVINHKRLFRIYREKKRVVRKRGGRKRALGTSRRRSPSPKGQNQRHEFYSCRIKLGGNVSRFWAIGADKSRHRCRLN